MLAAIQALIPLSRAEPGCSASTSRTAIRRTRARLGTAGSTPGSRRAPPPPRPRSQSTWLSRRTPCHPPLWPIRLRGGPMPSIPSSTTSPPLSHGAVRAPARSAGAAFGPEDISGVQRLALRGIGDEIRERVVHVCRAGPYARRLAVDPNGHPRVRAVELVGRDDAGPEDVGAVPVLGLRGAHAEPGARAPACRGRTRRSRSSNRRRTPSLLGANVLPGTSRSPRRSGDT